MVYFISVPKQFIFKFVIKLENASDYYYSITKIIGNVEIYFTFTEQNYAKLSEIITISKRNLQIFFIKVLFLFRIIIYFYIFLKIKYKKK